MAFYNYQISATPHNKVHPGALAYEIHSDINIKKKLVAVDPVSQIGDTVSITFIEELTILEQSALGTLIANHEGEPSTLVNEFGVPRVVIETPVSINTAAEEDGRQIVTPSPIGVGWNVFFVGADDDEVKFAIHQMNPFAPSGRGDGKPFLVEVLGEDVDPTIEEFSFVEPIHIHDGEVNWGPDGYWNYVDKFSIGIRFSPTAVSITPGTGNCNLVSVITQQVVFESSGMELIVPAAGDGYFTVDLDDCCPIRNTNKKGFWSVDEDTGAVSMDNSGVAMFDLYTFAPQDAWLMKNVATANSKRIMEPDVYRTELIHPSWKVIMSVTKVTPGMGWLTGWFTCFRKNVQ